MSNERIVNEQSFRAGRKALGVIAGLLREEEQLEFLHEVSEIVREAILSYQAAIERLGRRPRSF